MQYSKVEGGFMMHVDTRRDIQSEDEKSRDDLDDRLLMKGIYDG